MPKPIRFDEHGYHTWYERREAETQVQRVLSIREQQDRATNDLLWGFGYLIGLPAVVTFAVWIGGKLS